jgi:hypothetical protein
MEFAIGTLIGVFSALVAYLTYRAQKNQAFKRIHYSSFMMDLVLPMNDKLKEKLEFRFNGEALINPVLCVAAIQNTGASPIVRSDFDSPLTISSREKMVIIRHGVLEFDPPSMLDVDYPEKYGAKVFRNKFILSPMLMNPKDRITLYYIADMVPEEWGVEVASHIAGIEKVIRLPHPREETGTAAHTIRAVPISGVPTSGNLIAPEQDLLTLTVWTSPVFANPGDLFGDLLDVTIDGTIVEKPSSFIVTIHNGRPESFDPADDSEICLDFPHANIVHILTQGEGPEVSKVDLTRRARLISAHRIAISPPRLARGEVFNVCAIVSGEYDDLKVSCREFVPDQAFSFGFVVNDLISNNIAKMQPQLLLSNQRAWVLWQKLARKFRYYRAMLTEELRQEYRVTGDDGH